MADLKNYKHLGQYVIKQTEEDEDALEISQELPLLPLRGVVVFPNMVAPLDVGRERSISALEEAMVQDRLILLAAQKEAAISEPTPDDIYRVGTVGRIKQLLKLPDGTVRILVEGIDRVYIQRYLHLEPFFKVQISLMEKEEVNPLELEALTRAVLDKFEEYVRLSTKFPSELYSSISGIKDPVRLTDSIASQLPTSIENKQEILETQSIRLRVEKLLATLNREIEILKVERKIHGRVRKQMEKSQKEFYLREQIKAIQKELGERDERTAEIEEYKEKIAKAKLPKEVEAKATDELKRLEKMPPMAAEAVVVRTYLDWLLALPWTKKTKDRLDLAVAQEILDEDHYGLEKVKERILEFLAVRHLTKKLKGPILCLVGPPGVGKTSLAKSVARALERKFVRFSLGGVRDEAEIRGHRRTYVGAMPGKIIQAMKEAGSKNPVMLLDEIDKMSMDFRGDPSSALLEVLDPEQNSNFGDHYLELTYDLSDVLFITTANLLDNIPGPLRDRMEVITIPGYTEEEKLNIAKGFLVPKQLEAHGLTEENLTISENALLSLIREYTREAGVRNLEREIAALCRKAAKAIVQGESQGIKVTLSNLEKYLGVPRYHWGETEEENLVGVANGLAWTEVGGDLMAIEVAVMPGTGKLTLTGKLGEVMKESAQASYSYIRSRADNLGIDPEFHEKKDIHIHCPEGAIPKDGPSAGITMAVALASALTGIPVRKDVAMTGEITLRGRVLPIGGLKEKALAANRAGISTLIIPERNRKDVKEIPENIRKKLDFRFVNHMDEVLEIALVR
ncbi:MAG: endopeptidase La [Firmicutes bacterium]|nr:endopeptidase La [Bacillota bacterium]